jgi:hypothetical protein
MSNATFSTTPTTCLQQIHFYLWLHETVKNARVCRTWRLALNQDAFWKSVCAIRQLVALNGLCYKQQATFLRAEVRLNPHVAGIKMQCCDQSFKLYSEPAVSITIATTSREMQMLWCKKLSITDQSPLLFSWMPVKYFFNRDGSYKTQEDQIIVEYLKRELFFTLCKQEDEMDFCDLLKNKVVIGVASGAVSARCIDYVKRVANRLTFKVTIGK